MDLEWVKKSPQFEYFRNTKILIWLCRIVWELLVAEAFLVLLIRVCLFTWSANVA